MNLNNQQQSIPVYFYEFIKFGCIGGQFSEVTGIVCSCNFVFEDFVGSLSHIVLSASFMTKTISLDDKTYKYQIWDTAGQEKVSDGGEEKLGLGQNKKVELS